MAYPLPSDPDRSHFTSGGRGYHRGCIGCHTPGRIGAVHGYPLDRLLRPISVSDDEGR